MSIAEALGARASSAVHTFFSRFVCSFTSLSKHVNLSIYAIQVNYTRIHMEICPRKVPTLSWLPRFEGAPSRLANVPPLGIDASLEQRCIAPSSLERCPEPWVQCPLHPRPRLLIHPFFVNMPLVIGNFEGHRISS